MNAYETLKENSAGSSAVIANCSLLLGCFQHSRALHIVSESRLAGLKCIDIVKRFLAKDGYENVIHVCIPEFAIRIRALFETNLVGFGRKLGPKTTITYK